MGTEKEPNVGPSENASTRDSSVGPSVVGLGASAGGLSAFEAFF
jgi:hypothetical protein